MKYTEYLRKYYRGKRMLRLGYSIETFLDNNVDSSIPQPFDFIELDTALYELISQKSFGNLICHRDKSEKGVDYYTVYNLAKKDKVIMKVGFKSNSSVYWFESLKIPESLADKLMSFVFLSKRMSKTITIIVSPRDIKVMS